MNEKQIRMLKMPAGEMMDAFISKKLLGMDVDFDGAFPFLHPYYSGTYFEIVAFSKLDSAALTLLSNFPYVKLEFDSATWQCVISPDLENEYSASSDLSNPSLALAICRAVLVYAFRDQEEKSNE